MMGPSSIARGFPLLALAALLPAPASGQEAAPKRVDFNRDIRPILSNKCILCHGPDETERKADLRLDLSEGATADLGGYAAIVPGKPEESELIARITSEDSSLLMPPRKTGKSLTPAEVDLLKRWVAEGGSYAKHWAYEKPARPEVPAVKGGALVRNPIDAFLLARLEKDGLTFSPEADRQALARRVALDLTGLPPTPAEIDAFVADQAPDAYERFVDRMLAKPSYGEHWARLWLDLARYADSAGYADDPLRTIWAYRDYVIRSYNDNKPFDQFTIEQIAGDLLPNPTEDQIIATAFHRNTMTNSEGGTNDEEFRNVAVVDRVNTTWTVWMGTSMACAQCHTHKYDPLSQREYFRSFAFFNNTQDADRPDESPTFPIESAEQKRQKADWTAEIDRLQSTLRAPTPELQAARDRWDREIPRELPWKAPAPRSLKASSGASIEEREDGSIFIPRGSETDTYAIELPLETGPITAVRLEALADDALPDKGPGHAGNGNFVITGIRASLTPPELKRATGRFVRVELPGKEKILSLAEVEVFSGEENVARKGEASQSSTAYDGPAPRAIDGNTDGRYDTAKSTTHTEHSESPWWEVDLKGSVPIDRIAVWNRTDGGVSDRLNHFRVVVLDEQRKPVWESAVDSVPAPSTSLATNNIRPVRFNAAFADYAQAGFPASDLVAKAGDKPKGWAVGGATGASHALTLLPEAPIEAEPGSILTVTIEQGSKHAGHTLGHFRLDVTGHPRAAEFARIPTDILAILKEPAGERDPREVSALATYHLGIAPELQPARDRLAALTKQLAEMKPYTTVPVQRELPPGGRRVTKVQLRGNFMDLGEEVTEGTPEVFPPLPDGAPDRLALARWLASPENPLTARVLANRYWEQVFGMGLVRTSEEFGSQGELPTHPELLDWLATEMIARGWDPKSFLKLLVTSTAYRQSSKVTPELQEKDPDNRYYGRGPRFRISAEVVRDQVLAVSGLLSPKMYGPPVNPPRPATGLNAAFGSAIDRQASTGPDRYRRGIYTEWRRTNPYPSMTTFDAPNRDVCTVRRNRTNTPLQALVTLNDPVYIEAAQALARRMMAGASTDEDRARLGVKLCLARAATDAEVDQLVGLFRDSRADYAQHPEQAKQMATAPLGPAPEGMPEADLASWTVVANVLLNLDEMFLKR